MLICQDLQHFLSMSIKSDAAHDEAINDYTTICSCMTRAQLDTLIGYECFDVFYLDFDMYERKTLIQQFCR